MATWRDATGKRRRRVVGSTRAEAEAVLAKIIRDRDLERAGMSLDRGLSMVVAQLVDQYLADLATRARPKSVQEARGGLARVLDGLGARTVRDITAPAVIAWRAARVSGRAANKTANTEVGYLKAALGLAVRLGQLAAHPLAGLRGLPIGGRHQVRRPRALSDWELRRLFQAAEELDREACARWIGRGSLHVQGDLADVQGGANVKGASATHEQPIRNESIAVPRSPGPSPSPAESANSRHKLPLPRAPLVRALALTGARWGELAAATWSDLDRERGTLTLRAETTKTERARAIPIVPELLTVLLALPAIYTERLGRRPSSGSRIFLSPEGRPWDKGRQNFYRFLRDVFARASIPHTDELGRVVHVHALRHTFATRLARAGVPVATAQRLTGHRSSAVLLSVYTHIDSEETRSALEGLPTLGVASNLPRPSPADTSCAAGSAPSAPSELAAGSGSPGRARTYNNPVNSRVVVPGSSGEG